MQMCTVPYGKRGVTAQNKIFTRFSVLDWVVLRTTVYHGYSDVKFTVIFAIAPIMNIGMAWQNQLQQCGLEKGS